MRKTFNLLYLDLLNFWHLLTNYLNDYMCFVCKTKRVSYKMLVNMLVSHTNISAI